MICRCCQNPKLPQDCERGVCLDCLLTSRGVACMTSEEPRRAEVAESGQAFHDDFERVHGHVGQGARRLD